MVKIASALVIEPKPLDTILSGTPFTSSQLASLDHIPGFQVATSYDASPP